MSPSNQRVPSETMKDLAEAEGATRLAASPQEVRPSECLSVPSVLTTNTVRVATQMI